MQKNTYFFIIMILNSLLSAKPALSLTFIFPVACQLDHACYIQQYVDHQPQLNGRDFKGGQLASAHHRGTDIALPAFNEMNQGIRVLAAASGKVTTVQNRATDNTRMTFSTLSSRNCGNTIVIQHNDGWQTQYCHLKQKSTRVNPGQQVEAGEVIAAVGSSGQADYPGLEFIVTQNNEVIDPFAENLWQSPIPYQATGLIDIGITLETPTFNQLMTSPIKLTSFSLTDPTLYPWVRIFGAQASSQQRFVFYDNTGKIYATSSLPPINRFYPSWFAYTQFNVANRVGVEQTGNWRIDYQLKHDDHDWQTLGSVAFSINFYTKN